MNFGVSWLAARVWLALSLLLRPRLRLLCCPLSAQLVESTFEHYADIAESNVDYHAMMIRVYVAEAESRQDNT